MTTTTSEIVLTADQQAAVEAACQTIESENGTLVIGGLAGTGKTTIVKEVLANVKGKHIAVSAFTGKAVSVLRQKGVPRAQTLHSLMYTPEKRNGQLTFVRRAVLEADAVIVDEASMINTELHQDLLSYDVPIVFIGDHGQLEPIGDNPRVMESPDIRLEKIHRQAGKSPILFYAHLVREGKRLDWSTVPGGGDLQSMEWGAALESCHDFDAIICGFNKTRRAFNKKVRQNLGFFGPPSIGERIICLKNSRSRAFFNGMMLQVKKVKGGESRKIGDENLDVLIMDLESEDGQDFEDVEVFMVAPQDNPNEMNLQYWDSEENKSGEVLAADFGYALTAHKSQGSEFEKVLVVEEIWREKWDPRRWRYTAATRAAKKLTWVVQ